VSDSENKPLAYDIDAENDMVLAASRRLTRRSFALAAFRRCGRIRAYRWVV